MTRIEKFKGGLGRIGRNPMLKASIDTIAQPVADFKNPEIDALEGE